MIFIFLVSLFSLTFVNAQCQPNSCQNIPSPVGFKYGNGSTEVVNADCCSLSRGFKCYLSEYQQCGNDGTNMDNVVCPKKGFVPCSSGSINTWRDGCCNTQTSRCEVYSEKNGFKVSRCVLKLDNNLGFVIVALPLMLTLFTIFGLVVLFIYSKDIFQQEDILDKVSGAFSFLIILFSIFYFYSNAWVYGIVMAVTSAIGLRTLPATDLPTRFVGFFAYLFLFYAVTGWGLNNGWIGGWGSGSLFDAVSTSPNQYSTYFNRDGTTSAKWVDRSAALRAGKDASLVDEQWGYLDSGWLFTLAFFALFEIFFISFMLVSMTRRLFQNSSPPPKGGLREPFLS